MTDWAIRAVAIVGVMLVILTTASGQAPDADGANLFARYCASCHGRVGEGDGPVASAMVINVPNLRTLSARSNGSFPRDAVTRYIDGRNSPLAHGDRIMPVWGNTFTEGAEDSDSPEDVARQRIDAITEFVEQLQN